MYHKLLKSTPDYDLWSNIKSFTDNLFDIWLKAKKQKMFDSENEAKQNQYNFPCAIFMLKNV